MAPSRPHFYKIMMGDFSDHLRIPPAFVKSISNGGSQRAVRATLVGPSGGAWQVTLSRWSRRDLYIEDGWQKFVKEHSLQEYDFLLFRYDGDNRFTVQIFDKTACEREDSFTVQGSLGHEISQGRKKRARKDICLPVSSDLVLRNSNGMNTTQHRKGHCSAHDVRSCKLCTDVKFIEDGVDHDQDCKDEGAVKNFPSFTSENPFFSKELTKSYVCSMVIMLPSAFCDSHLPKCSCMVDLQDPEGRSWKVRYLYYRYTKIFSAGLSSFIRNNNLKAGDVCVFELVGELKFEVHIFRPNKQLALICRNK